MKPTSAKLNTEMTLTIDIFNLNHLEALKVFVQEAKDAEMNLRILNHRHCGVLRDGHVLVSARKVEDIS